MLPDLKLYYKAIVIKKRKCDIGIKQTHKPMEIGESWAIKKAEHQSIDVFKLWYWRRLLRVPGCAMQDQP